MTMLEKKMFIKVITLKLNRGESLEDVLASYTKLSDADKQELRDYFHGAR